MNFKKIIFCGCILVGGYVYLAYNSYLTNIYLPHINSIESMITEVKPSVVRIENSSKISDPQYQTTPYDDLLDEYGPSPKEHFKESGALGTGTIISEDGTILTANHVVKNSTEINVKLFNGKMYKVHILFQDEKSDIAILRFNDEIHNLSFSKLADSSKIREGETVIAIGNPFGLYNTVSKGIVSSLSTFRNNNEYIQTDAAINPGNSGGPLFDLNGNIIAVNDEILSKTGEFAGIGFSIPSNVVKKDMEDFQKYGKVKRGKIGVVLRMSDDLIENTLGINLGKGLVIIDVEKNSPATGIIQDGDYIVSVNAFIDGKNELIYNLDNTEKFVKFIQDNPDTIIDITIIRNGKNDIKRLKIGEQ